jgi:type IV pilus assembly protein PilM
MSRLSRTRTLVGLDIEPGWIAAAEVSADGGLTLERAAAAPLEPHVMRDGEVADADGLTQALKALWRDHRKLGKRVRVGVANARIVVRALDVPPLEDRRELAAAVRFQAQDELPMPLDAAVLDFQPLGIVETPAGPRQRVVLVAARRDMVDRVLAATRAAGLRPEAIDLSAFAMVRALRDADSGPALFLSVSGLTNLAIVDERGGCLFTRVAGGGLEGTAAELAERQGLTLDRARAALVEVGLSAPLETLEGDEALAARSVLTEGIRRVAGEVRASLDFHHAQVLAGPMVERIVLTGAALEVPGFADALGAEVGLPVVSRGVDVTRPGVLDGLDAGRLAVAAGLGVEEAPR